MEQGGYYTLDMRYRDDIALRALELTQGGTVELEVMEPKEDVSGYQEVRLRNEDSLEHGDSRDGEVVEQVANDVNGLRSLLTPVEQNPEEVSDGCIVYGYNLDRVLVQNSGVQDNVVEQFDFGSIRFDSEDLAEHVELEDVEQFLGYGGGYESGSSQEW